MTRTKIILPLIVFGLCFFQNVTVAESLPFMHDVFEAESMPENIVLQNEVIDTTEIYEAWNSITAGPSVLIVPPGNVTFRAGKKIYLKPGFEARSGSGFHAFIDAVHYESHFSHETGQRGSEGWEVDYKKHDSGYLIYGLNLPLPEGDYKATFYLRRGKYCDGFDCGDPLTENKGIVNIQVYDLTTQEILPKQRPGRTSRCERDLKCHHFPDANVYKEFSIQFTTRGCYGHRFDLRAYWPGLGIPFGKCNMEVDKVELQLDRGVIWFSPDYAELAAKAATFDNNIQKYHLDNGQI